MAGIETIKLVFDRGFMRTGGNPYFVAGNINLINASIVGTTVGKYKINHSIGHLNYFVLISPSNENYEAHISARGQNSLSINVHNGNNLADPNGYPIYVQIFTY